MKCEICTQEVQLTISGRFPLHRIYGKDRYTFCPMSGEPVPGAEPRNEVA